MATSGYISKEELPPNIVMKDCNAFYCKCCSCILGGVGCMRQHVAGKRHNKEMQRIGAYVTPPGKEIFEAGARPTEDTHPFVLPPGVIESKERWKSFYCTYCNCELGATDMKIHVVGKRHTKRANKAALEDIMNRGGQHPFEVRDGKMTGDAVDKTATEAGDSRTAVSEGIEVTAVCAESRKLENTSTASMSKIKNDNEINAPAKTESQKISSANMSEVDVSLKMSAEESSSTKNDLHPKATVTDASPKDAAQDNTSKNASHTNQSLKTVSEKTSSRNSSQGVESVESNSETHSPEDVAQQTTMPIKISRGNDSVKDTSQSFTNNADCKTSSPTTVTPTAALQGEMPIKGASQATHSVKSALLKIVPQAKFSAKPALQTKTALQTSQLKTSLSEYFTTVSNPIVGLNYVEETQIPDGQSVFQCNLCNVGGDAEVIKHHINATKHHLEYLRTVDPIKAAEVKDLKDSERNQKILEHVIELERKKGRGTILVKTAKMKTTTGNDEVEKINSKSNVMTPTKNSGSSISDQSNAQSLPIQIVAQEFLTKDVICKAQSRDPNTSKIIKELTEDIPNSSYVMHNDILYERRNGKYRVVVAQAMKQAIYENYHFSLCRKTPAGIAYINDSYSWSGINEDIAKFAKQCYICQIRRLRQFSDGEAIPILVRRGRGKKVASSTRRAFNDLTNEEIVDTQRKDPDTTKLIFDVENGLETNKYVIFENILYIVDENGHYKIVVSPQMKKLIFEKNHSMLCWKSTERPPLINAITHVYFWQRMLEEVKSFAAKCKSCRVNIPLKRISDQKNSAASPVKITKKTTDKTQNEVNRSDSRRKLPKTSKGSRKERSRERDKSKEKSPRSSSWDKTKSLKPPIVEQDILTEDTVRDAQKKDLTTSKIIKLLMDGTPSSSYILYEGILYQEKNGKYLTMVADKMKQAIYEKCHSSLCSRHTSRSSQRKGTRYISRHFSWAAMSQDIYIFTKNCHVCQVRTLRTKAFSNLLPKEHYNNKLLAAASRSAFNDLTDDEIINSQQRDPDTLKILHQIEEGMHVSRYILYEGILYHQGAHGDYKIVTTPEMKQTIYQNNHFQLCWESTSWQDTVEMIAQIYLWPQIHEDIRDFMETCQVCKRRYPEQSYLDPLSYGSTFSDGDKTSNLTDQYPSYSDPAYDSSTQQYQSGAMHTVDPYTATNAATSSYGSYQPYWNTTSDTTVAYSAPNSAKRPMGEDMDHDSYSRRKRHRSNRSDFSAEYEYSRSQDGSLCATPFEEKTYSDQNMPFSAKEATSLLPPAYQPEVNKPYEAENSSNSLGFTINNAEDAEVTLDIINSLMQIYLKYQLKKLHGPVQKLLQETEGNKAASRGEGSTSDRVDDIDTSELFERLPRLKKGGRDVKESNVFPVTAVSECFRQPLFGRSPSNKSRYTSDLSTLKSDKFTPSNFSRDDTVDTLTRKSSHTHKASDVGKDLSLQNDDDIDGFPMTSETSDVVTKVRSRWDDDDDDIDGEPLSEDISENTDNIPKKSNLKDSPDRSTSLFLPKSLQTKNDVDGIPFGFRTSSSQNKLQIDADTLFKKPLDKLETKDNKKKDGPFLKPDSSKIFKKPPDDWDKNAKKAQEKIKSNPSTKQNINLSESNDHDTLDAKAFSDKYPNWKKSETQGGTSFYNSPLYSKVNEGGSVSNSNAPVIDLFRRYRRVQL